VILEIGEGELTEVDYGCGVVGTSGGFFGSEVANERPPHTHDPFVVIVVPTNALEFGRVLPTRFALVAAVAAIVRDPHIVPLAIETVVVLVVDLNLGVGDIHDVSVKFDGFVSSVMTAAEIDAASSVHGSMAFICVSRPFELVDPFKVFIVDECYVTLSQWEFSHPTKYRVSDRLN